MFKENIFIQGHYIHSRIYINLRNIYSFKFKAMCSFKETIFNSAHAPRKTKTVRTRTSTPWYSAEICAARKLKRKLEKKWRKSGLPEDFIAFIAQRNHVTYMMNDARRIFYTDFIAENNADQGKLFRAAKKLLAKKEVPHFPEYCDNIAIANEIGRFFARKIELIRLGIDANGPMNNEDQVMNNNTNSNEDMALSSFQLLTENDMCDIIQRSFSVAESHK